MTERKVNKQIPVFFQSLEKYEKEDTRFLKIRIWLMHTGLNLNGSHFSKEAVEKAIPSLANTAILAYVEENSSGELDFSDHRMILHRTESGDVDLKYLGSAVGIIPETNNAHWEMRVTDSGEEKEYLVVDGLMWTKWGDPTDIMKNKNITSQSMELHDDYTGSWDNNGVFHFDSFKFNGACLLGDDVLPAMQNSTVEVQFSKDTNLQKSIENKLQEFYTLFSQQGGTGMEDNTKVEEVKATQETELETEFTEAKVDETETQETEKVEENFEADKTDAEANAETEVKDTQEFEKQNEEKEEETLPAQEFALTARQLQDQLRNALSKETHVDRWGDSCRNYWYVDHTDSVVIFENTQDGYQLYATAYTLNGDNVELQLDGAYKVKVEYVAFEGDSVAFTANHERFESEQSETQSQLDTLNSYKRTREEEDLQAKFADKLSTEEFTQVFTEMKESELDKVEEKLFALIGKKNFTVSKPAGQVNKVSFSLPKEEDTVHNPYGDIFED